MSFSRFGLLLWFSGQETTQILRRRATLSSSHKTAIQHNLCMQTPKHKHPHRDIVSGRTERTDAVLQLLGGAAAAHRSPDERRNDVAIVQHVVAIVGLRAARLVAANTAVVLERIGDDASDDDDGDGGESGATGAAKVTVIAIDGSVYKFHPRLKDWLQLYIGAAVPQHKVGCCSFPLPHF